MSDLTHCPACGQSIQVHRRSITPPMLGSLRRLFEITQRAREAPPQDGLVLTPAGEVWVHAALFSSASKGQQDRDYSKLRYWGLIAPRPAAPGEKVAGYWGITALGIRFLQGAARIPRNVFVFNNQVQSISPEVITIEDL